MVLYCCWLFVFQIQVVVCGILIFWKMWKATWYLPGHAATTRWNFTVITNDWWCFQEGKQVDIGSSSSLLLIHKSRSNFAAITLTITVLCQSVYTVQLFTVKFQPNDVITLVLYWCDSTVHVAVSNLLESGTKRPYGLNAPDSTLDHNFKHW